MNIGYVQYTASQKPNELNAVWVQSNTEQGTGIAVGHVTSDFDGEYQVTYIDLAGNELITLALTIEKNESIYHLTWRNQGTVTSKGIGMKNGDILSASYIDM